MVSVTDTRKPFDAEPGGVEDAPDGYAMELDDGWYERCGKRWYPVSTEDGCRLQAEYLKKYGSGL